MRRKRTPVIVRTPVVNNNGNGRKQIGKTNPKRFIEMRKAEQHRITQVRIYTRYKNLWFQKLFITATGFKELTDWEKMRLKELRKTVEEAHNVPINYFSVFVYKQAYEYLQWPPHKRSNAVGFFCNERGLSDFSGWLSEQSFAWRKRRSNYPSDFGKRWGRKLNIVNQVLGTGKDRVFEGKVL